MTTVDDLWYLAERASQQAEQVHHRLAGREEMEFELHKRVSRERFRTVATRIADNGAPYGVHTLVTRQAEGGSDDLLLVRHAGVDMWVLPGGETRENESFREGAERELREEAGVTATYSGLGSLGQVRFRSGDHVTWGVLPVFEATPVDDELTVADPDGEVTDAGWFPLDELPADTRDREHLLEWCDSRR